MGKTTRFVILGLLCALLALGGTPSSAQAPADTLTMEAVTAWEGYIRQNWWTEVRVTLRNEGADWQGELVIRDTQSQVTYRRPVELPVHSYKQYRVPLFVKDTMMLTIALQDGKETRQEAHILLNGYGESSRVVVSADTRRPIMEATPYGAVDTHIWLPDLDSLPETPMAWDVADVLLLNGVSTANLTPAQQEALLAWVGAGGHLIVGGGAALQQTLAHLPDPLRVAAPGEARIIPQVSLDNGTLKDVAAVALTTDAHAIPLATAGDTVLAVRGAVGKGQVDIVGWDMAHPGGTNWLVALWAGDHIPAVTTPVNGGILSTGGPNIYKMLEIPYTFFSKFWGWLILFPVYIFLVGPGTLILTRRLKRPILAWIFIPAWIIGALLILAGGLSNAFSRTFPLIHEVAIIPVPDAALPARVVQGTAIYAPRIRRLAWDTAGAPRPLLGSHQMDSWYNEGNPFPVEASYRDGNTTLQVRNPLGVITWGTEGLYESPAIKSDLRITLQDGLYYITGQVWSEADLRDVALLMGDTSYHITLTQTIPQGASAAISRPVTATNSSYGSYTDICGNINYNYIPYSMPASTSTPYSALTATSVCYLTGFIDEVPFPTYNIGGTHIQESCLIYSVPCPTQPSGNIEATLDSAASKTENGWVDTYTHIAYANAPGATFEYVLPVYLHIGAVDKLALALLPVPEASVFTPLKDIEEVAVWNWSTGKWMDFLPTHEIVLTGVTARQAFDAQQGVRVRITPTSGTVTVKLIVTVTGTP
ncbi:MAG TPA: hypothetical protein PKZ84_07800 [Anaerolineae bacterium]|nr:hypothetical protein [Anaerolineae bacterium]HQI84373.1 hypothetical protein [Anaerolineae bacterium]